MLERSDARHKAESAVIQQLLGLCTSSRKLCLVAYLFTCGAWCNCRDDKNFVLSIEQFRESHVCLSFR